MKRELSLDELKNIELGILDHVVSFCEDNNITYFLDSGTLLGAVRHGGFIPWDDDIDIIMPRCDYKKFINTFNNTGRYKVLSSDTVGDYFYPFAKVIDSNTELEEKEYQSISGYGVYIDVFPVDGLPDEEKVRKKFQDKLWIMRSMLSYSAIDKKETNSMSSKFKRIACSAVGWKRILKNLEKKVSLYDLNDTRYAASMVSSSEKYIKVNSDIFKSYTEILFENKYYKVPQDYKEYLTILYGDYMKLPPEEQRVTHHRFRAYQK